MLAALVAACAAESAPEPDPPTPPVADTSKTKPKDMGDVQNPDYSDPPWGSGSGSASYCTSYSNGTKCYLVGTSQCCYNEVCTDCTNCTYLWGFNWCTTSHSCTSQGATTCDQLGG